MKNLLLVAVLAVISVMTPSLLAQTQDGHSHPDVPQTQVVEKAKPYLGDWNAVVCEPKPYGVRFNVRLDTAKDEEGKDNTTPIFHLLAVQIMDIGSPFDFITVSFKEYGDITALAVTNNQLELALFPNKSGLGLEVGDEDGGFSTGFAEKGDYVKDQWGYVENLGKSCPVPDKSADNRNQVASR
jgi:hypothetical protein